MKNYKHTSKSLLCTALALVLLATTAACSSQAPSTAAGSGSDVSALYILPDTSADLAGFSQATVVDKEEVVYALLAYDGAVDNAYVVNHFKLSSPGYLTDHGNYSLVNNLTNTYPLTLDGSDVAIAAQKGDYYYQGDVKDPQLPWKIQIAYKLDGQAVDAKDINTLAGKSGHLEIAITSTQNLDIDPSFYEHYTLQISLTIDASKSSNIDAPDATIAAAGVERQINYTVLPNSDGNLTFAADVVDFAMPGLQIAAVPFSMNFETPDTSEISGEMNELVQAVSGLNSGVYDLNSGAAELAGGAGDLSAAAQQLLGGVTAFGEGLDAASGGSSQLNAGAEQLSGSLGQIAGGLQAMQDGGAFDYLQMAAPDTYAQLLALIAGLDGVVGGYTDPQQGLNAGLKNYTGGVDALAKNFTELEAGLEQLSGGAAQLSSGVAGLAAGTSNLAAGTSELYGGVRNMPQTMQAQIDEFVSNYDFSGFEPHSYLSADNPKVSLVQFIIKTPDIETPAAKGSANEALAEQSFWDRILALFN